MRASVHVAKGHELLVSLCGSVIFVCNQQGVTGHFNSLYGRRKLTSHRTQMLRVLHLGQGESCIFSSRPPDLPSQQSHLRIPPDVST